MPVVGILGSRIGMPKMETTASPLMHVSEMAKAFCAFDGRNVNTKMAVLQSKPVSSRSKSSLGVDFGRAMATIRAEMA